MLDGGQTGLGGERPVLLIHRLSAAMPPLALLSWTFCAETGMAGQGSGQHLKNGPSSPPGCSAHPTLQEHLVRCMWNANILTSGPTPKGLSIPLLPPQISLTLTLQTHSFSVPDHQCRQISPSTLLPGKADNITKSIAQKWPTGHLGQSSRARMPSVLFQPVPT